MAHLLAAILLALLAAVPASVPAASPADVDVPAALQALLDQRAAAVMAGDEAAFLATVDAPFRPEQAARFEGAATVGFSRYELRLRWDTGGDLATAAVRARYAPAPAVVGYVEIRTAIAGYDERPALTSDFLTFVRRRDAWLVASDRDLDGLGLLSTRELWDLGPVVSTASARVLILSHADAAEQAEAVLAAMESALDRLADGLDIVWPERVVVVLPSSIDELQRILQATVDLRNFVAFAYWGVDRDHGWSLTTARVILNPETFFLASDDVREDILVHELVHVATRKVAGPASGAWIDEGLADLIAGGPGTLTPPADGELPESWRFGSGSGLDIRDAYARSRSFVAFLDTRPPGALAYYRALGASVGEPGSRTYLQDRAARDVFGVGLAELRHLWAGGG